MTSTITSRSKTLEPQIDIVLLAGALGLQAREFHPKMPGPVSQCPACLSKPRQPGHDCKPNVTLSAALHRIRDLTGSY